ncbi:MAG: phosphotransferase [Gammaproteobacteria bacterium]|nr:phosphotransferase [Gammaproteobacteria bacterium]MBT5204024.1 phosphotransferase [Gammaproteobacteria bacterium]MBT5602722.1 phosphotransferase [Gammaproteobacteria bacterium]MBT6243846.1 phosphotransferase [Gammaproteobacteria bacterium]
MKKLPNSALLELDPAKQSFIKARFGRAGINWIRDFPELVQTCQAQWGLALIGRAEAGLEVNTVFYAQRGDQQCVLKIGLPHPEQLTEIEALRLFSSDKVVNVLDWDEPKRALLMERVRPGRSLRSLLDNPELDCELINYAAPLLVSIQVPADNNCQLPTYQNWLKRGFEPVTSGQVPRLAAHVELASSFNRALNRKWRDVSVLHGDLHHDNILQDSRLGWVAIDPKGVVGPRIFDCGRFIHNFLPYPTQEPTRSRSQVSDADLILKRCQRLSELSSYPVDDLIAVGFIDLTLAICWTFADGDPVNYRSLDAFANLLKNPG